MSTPHALHVAPLGDLLDHAADDDCMCGPTPKPIKATDGAVNWVMIHHSLDGREDPEVSQSASEPGVITVAPGGDPPP